MRIQFYPPVHDKKKVGTFPAKVKIGGGFRYDRILEYRLLLKLRTRNLRITSYFLPFESPEKAEEVRLKIIDIFGRTVFLSEIVALVEQDWWYELHTRGLYLGPDGERYGIGTTRRIAQWPMRILFKDNKFVRIKRQTARKRKRSTDSDDNCVEDGDTTCISCKKCGGMPSLERLSLIRRRQQ